MDRFPRAGRDAARRSGRGARLANVGATANTSCNRRRGLRWAWHGPGQIGWKGMFISRAWAGVAGENGLASSNPIKLLARAAQSLYPTDWDLVSLVLTLRLRARSRRRGSVAQGACPS